MSTPRINDALLDKFEAVYRAEYDRWSWRRKLNNSGFELVRHVIHDENEIINLTKRECKNSDDAQSWLNTFRGRAAIQAVLRVVAERTVNTLARMRHRKRNPIVGHHHVEPDPLRNNPIVGFMSEAQAERILAEMRGERS